LAVYVLAACAFLGLRYWVLPRVDQWRAQIEQYASDALGSPVRIGHIAADWSGLNPRLRLASVRIYEAGRPDPALDLPSVGAVVSWRSLISLSPRFLSLRVDAADLTVRRDAEGRLWVAGQAIDPDAPSHGPSPALRWLLAQHQIMFYRTTLRWQDEQRQAPELVFSDLDLLLRNGALSHRFGLRARTPDALAAGFSVRGEFNRRLFSRDGANPLHWDGQVYVQLDDAQPSAWQPWVSLPVQSTGRLAARAWLRVSHGQLEDVTLDTVLRGLHWQAPGDASGLAARAMRVRLQGAPGDLWQFDDLPLARSKNAAGLALNAEIEGLRVEAPGVFEARRLDFDGVQVDASLVHPNGQPRTLVLRQLHAVNADVDASLQGRWQEGGKDPAGIVDLRGTLARAAMSAIHRYLPLTVGQDARDWLARGLVAGEVRDAAVTLRGDLADFPYSQPGSTGEFRIAGTYRDAIVDYAPPMGKRKGWPRLEQLHGSFALNNVDLIVDSEAGRVPTGGAGQQLALGAVRAHIPNLEHDPELTVTGASEGAAASYLALAANSPLGDLLDGLLTDAKGDGTWQVPLTLRVPLLNTDDASVDGKVGFMGGAFQLMPSIPTFTQLHGELGFTERGVEAHNLHATFLGGPVRLSGGMGGGKALGFAGVLSAAGLAELSRSPGLQRLSGKTEYRGQLTYAKGADVDVSVQSDLKGLAIDLPAPLGKPAESAMPLRLQFSPATDRGPAGRRWLSGGLGQDINLLLEHDPSLRGEPYFARGALGVERAATLPAQGLSLSGTFDTLDLDAWRAAAQAFTAAPAPGAGRPGQAARVGGAQASTPHAATSSGTAAKASPGLLPPLNQVSLSARRLMGAGQALDALTLFAQRPTSTQWRVNLDARQAAGTLEWTQAHGAVAGKVVARFSRLMLGGEPDTEGNGASAGDSANGDAGSDLSDIPAIDLQAKQFVLYGHDVGSLEVMGTNLERGNLWHLDKLRIASDSATLNAAGQWRLSGADRGLTIDALITFADLGKFLDRIGRQGTVSAGSGTVQGRIAWHDFPWKHDLSGLQGGVMVSLDKGRFLNLNSRTARLLELLSLQSVRRLAKLQVNPSGVLRDGFPFDTVRGAITVGNGVVSTEGYKINGPVAAVVLGGSTDLIAERWDMRAAVIPNLDASGATLVTAILNPVIGLSAFVTQWLLKDPLAAAMTVEYQVSGSWDDPKIEPAPARSKAADKPPQTAPPAEEARRDDPQERVAH